MCNTAKNMQGTVTLAETYAAALDQTGAKILWAAIALNNSVTIGSDASNSFAKAPLPIMNRSNNYDRNAIYKLQQPTDKILSTVDLDFASDMSHSKLVTRICIKLAGGAILYKTRSG